MFIVFWFQSVEVLANTTLALDHLLHCCWHEFLGLLLLLHFHLSLRRGLLYCEHVRDADCHESGKTGDFIRDGYLSPRMDTDDWLCEDDRWHLLWAFGTQQSCGHSFHDLRKEDSHCDCQQLVGIDAQADSDCGRDSLSPGRRGLCYLENDDYLVHTYASTLGPTHFKFLPRQQKNARRLSPARPSPSRTYRALAEAYRKPGNGHH